jgi:hypothetical protein
MHKVEHRSTCVRRVVHVIEEIMRPPSTQALSRAAREQIGQ